MGRTITPPYRVEYRVAPGSRVGLTSAAWHVRPLGARPADGKPTQANLLRHLKALDASFRPGGANDHVTGVELAGARIVRQADGEVMAEITVERTYRFEVMGRVEGASRVTTGGTEGT